jgi:lysophosphatidate acyltransferase
MNLIGSLMKPAAYIGVPLYALHKASEVSPITRYYVRLGLYVSTLGLVSAWGVVVAIGMRLAGHQLDVNYVVARSFHLIAGRVLGITFEVEGEEHVEKAGAAVLVGNHQSMLDVLYLGRYVI